MVLLESLQLVVGSLVGSAVHLKLLQDPSVALFRIYIYIYMIYYNIYICATPSAARHSDALGEEQPFKRSCHTYIVYIIAYRSNKIQGPAVHRFCQASSPFAQESSRYSLTLNVSPPNPTPKRYVHHHINLNILA